MENEWTIFQTWLFRLHEHENHIRTQQICYAPGILEFARGSKQTYLMAA